MRDLDKSAVKMRSVTDGMSKTNGKPIDWALKDVDPNKIKDVSTHFGDLAASLGVIGGIAAAGFAGFAWVKSGIDDLAEMGREAQKLGISVEKLSDFQYAAGRSSGALDTALERLNVKLGEAAAG